MLILIHFYTVLPVLLKTYLKLNTIDKLFVFKVSNTKRLIRQLISHYIHNKICLTGKLNRR
jgi:hypothetical protein